jgi:prophage regulatory protein
MNIPSSETSPETILRLPEMLRMTGLSRSTLYNRIAKKEFPHQVPLGDRVVGWLKREVDDWISERIRLRPGSRTGISDGVVESANTVPRNAQSGRSEIQRQPDPISCVPAVNEGSPDLAQLDLVNTKLYFDKSTGSFWLKLLPEDPACRGRSPRVRIQDRC